MSDEFDQRKSEWNEYDYLRNQAAKRARESREGLYDAAHKFYRAIDSIRMKCFAHIPQGDMTELLEAIYEYPLTLKRVMDANDEANEMLIRANNIRRMEWLHKQREREEKNGK